MKRDLKCEKWGGSSKEQRVHDSGTVKIVNRLLVLKYYFIVIAVM